MSVSIVPRSTKSTSRRKGTVNDGDGGLSALSTGAKALLVLTVRLL